MNAWELTLKLIQKDKEQMDLGEKMNKETNPKVLRAYKTRMEAIDKEFLDIKHKLQEIDL